jgi:hypothetical protein
MGCFDLRLGDICVLATKLQYGTKDYFLQNVLRKMVPYIKKCLLKVKLLVIVASSFENKLFQRNFFENKTIE